MPWCDPYGWHNTTKEREIVAWSPATDDPPTKLHVPFWAKKSNPCVVATSLHVWAEQQLLTYSEKVVAEDADMLPGIGAPTNGAPH